MTVVSNNNDNGENGMSNDSNNGATIFILQSLPGGGKSTLASKLAEEHNAGIHSADSFPGLYPGVDEDGRLTIDPTKLGPAHGACMKGATEDVREGRSVVIDNTNISASEMTYYVGLAQAYGAAPVIVRVNCDPRTAFERNTHGVPFAVFKSGEGENVTIRKSFTFGEEPREGETLVGGFATMMARLAEFSPEFHWQFIPGFETREVENG